MYTTISNIIWAGEEYAVSFDFDENILEAMMSKLPVHIARKIQDELERDPYRRRTIEFLEMVEIPLSARLGELQTVNREEFIPFIVQTIL